MTMQRCMRRSNGAITGEICEIPIPDVLVIDGGPGQVTQARDVLSELGLHQIQLLGIAKGPTRKAGMEWLHVEGMEMPIRPQKDAPGLHLLQHIRDEAHRFAITKHEQARGKSSSFERVGEVLRASGQNDANSCCVILAA